MATNQFLPFCPTDSGTNLTPLVDYTADSDRVSGNQPGIARSALNNRALRQANFITSQIAQYIGDVTGTNVLDDANTSALLAIMVAAFTPKMSVTAVKTTTYTAVINEYVRVSGASGAWTLTLPTAVGMTGRLIRVKRTDDTPANAVTINTTSAQTIDGASTVHSMSQYEDWTFMSDGSNWSVVDHKAITPWTLRTFTFTGYGTVGTQNIYIRRVGDSAQILGSFIPGTGTSVDQAIVLPSGFGINYSGIASTSKGTHVGTIIRVNQNLGWPSASAGPYMAFVDGSTTTTIFASGGAQGTQGLTPKQAVSYYSSGDTLQLNATLPMTNWEA